jgi:4-hydroxy-tetrahydrodipicolinate synthase
MTDVVTREQLVGFVPAIVTPFTTSGEIMLDAYQDLVGWLIEIGATAICVAGDNGESWTLDAGERASLTAAAVTAAAGRVRPSPTSSRPLARSWHGATRRWRRRSTCRSSPTTRRAASGFP